jgi:hypothetical protein
VHGKGAAAAGRGGKSILSKWHQTKNERGILHTTGTHRIVVDQKKGKKGKKKWFNLLHLKKGEIGGLTKSCTFFQSWNKRALPK